MNLKKIKIIISASLILLKLGTFLKASQIAPDYQLRKALKLSNSEMKYYLSCIQKHEDYIVYNRNDSYYNWAAYYSVLPNLINQFNLKIGCEVGVAFGTHSAAILKNTSITKLYSVDPYSNFYPGSWHNIPQYPGIKPSIYSEVAYLKVKNMLSKFGERSELIRKGSVEASKRFSANSLDFVYIDALHTYQAVKADLHAWFDKVRSGGLISGDDYTSHFPGVMQAINEFFEGKKITINLDKQHSRFWWVLKP